MAFSSDNLPRQFGAYLLRDKLASGGMAELYFAELPDRSGNVQHVVIKMLHPNLSRDPHFLNMFTAEAKILSRLVHSNIIPIFDFGAVDGNLYLAMEFVDGLDAATLLETCRVAGLRLSPAIAT